MKYDKESQEIEGSSICGLLNLGDAILDTLNFKRSTIYPLKCSLFCTFRPISISSTFTSLKFHFREMARQTTMKLKDQKVFLFKKRKCHVPI